MLLQTLKQDSVTLPISFMLLFLNLMDVILCNESELYLVDEVQIKTQCLNESQGSYS